MPNYVQSPTRERLQARLLVKEALLLKAIDLYDSLLEKEVEDYRFASGEGSQQATRRKLDAVKKQIDALESEVEALYRRLGGKGVVNINVRRK